MSATIGFFYAFPKFSTVFIEYFFTTNGSKEGGELATYFF